MIGGMEQGEADVDVQNMTSLQNLENIFNEIGTYVLPPEWMRWQWRRNSVGCFNFCVIAFGENGLQTVCGDEDSRGRDVIWRQSCR